MGGILKKIWDSIFYDSDKKDIEKYNIIEKLANYLELEKISEYEYYEYPPLERKINLCELSEEIRNPISKIQKINKKYICKKCGETPLIFIYKKPLSIQNILYINCHNEFFIFNFFVLLYGLSWGLSQ